MKGDKREDTFFGPEAPWEEGITGPLTNTSTSSSDPLPGDDYRGSEEDRDLDGNLIRDLNRAFYYDNKALDDNVHDWDRIEEMQEIHEQEYYRIDVSWDWIAKKKEQRAKSGIWKREYRPRFNRLKRLRILQRQWETMQFEYLMERRSIERIAEYDPLVIQRKIKELLIKIEKEDLEKAKDPDKEPEEEEKEKIQEEAEEKRTKAKIWHSENIKEPPKKPKEEKEKMEEKIKDFEERKKRMEAWTKQEAIFKEEMIRRGYGHIVEQMERLEQNKKSEWTLGPNKGKDLTKK